MLVAEEATPPTGQGEMSCVSPQKSWRSTASRATNGDGMSSVSALRRGPLLGGGKLQGDGVHWGGMTSFTSNANRKDVPRFWGSTVELWGVTVTPGLPVLGQGHDMRTPCLEMKLRLPSLCGFSAAGMQN